MLWFERRVVDALTRTADQQRRCAVAAFADGALRSMPEYLRAGVAAESLLLGSLAALRGSSPDHADDGGLARLLSRWERGDFSLVRQYVRMLHSLTLYAEHELEPDLAS